MLDHLKRVFAADPLAGPAADAATLEIGATVKLVGVVRAVGEPWRAPFTGGECVSFIVREGPHWNGRTDGSTGRELLARSQDFWLECDGGTVLVRPEGWSEYSLSVTEARSDDETAYARFVAFSERYGMEHRETLSAFTNEMVMLEETLAVGARVAVHGAVGPRAERPAPRAGYRSERPLTLVPPPEGKLRVSDRPEHL
ncbi:MAG: hypothetical protein VYE22_03860 [Myxococcota bacterium]|nr:hypothetical protein [Myxococcota bacterium]